MKHSADFVSKLFAEVDALRKVKQPERDSIVAMLQLAAEESVEVSQACHKLLRLYENKLAEENGECARLRPCRKSEQEAYLSLVFELLDFEAVIGMAMDQMEIPNDLGEDDIIEIAKKYTLHKIARNRGIMTPEPTLEKPEA